MISYIVIIILNYVLLKIIKYTNFEHIILAPPK